MNDTITHGLVDLTGQVSIVTGGGRGIGRAIALALAKAGAKVAVAARSADQLAETVTLIEEARGHGLAITTDVTDQQSVEKMVQTTEEQFGPIDLLVNNAGLGGPIGPIWEVDPEQWWQCMDVNLRGPYLCSRIVLPGMVKRQSGRIITVASGLGVWPLPFTSAYSISKCAAIRFSESLAAEGKKHGICAFSINPGFVRTAMPEAIANSPEDKEWLGGLFSKSIEAGHDIPPERAAKLVLFLGSGRADTLSGCYIDVIDNVEDMVQRAEDIQEKQLYTLRLRTGELT